MELKKLSLEKNSNGSFWNNKFDGVCHTKTLPFLSVAQAVQGSYEISLSGSPVQSTGTRGFFIAPANVEQVITHRADTQTGVMECRWVFLQVLINDHDAMDDLYAFPTVLPEPYRTQMDAVFDRLFTSQNIFEEYSCYHEIARLLFCVATEKEPFSPAIRSAMEYVRTHFREKIAVEDLAQCAHLSPSRFFTIFKKATGCSPLSYVNTYRLAEATELLTKTEDSVSDIARSVGIPDPYYFNKIFRKTYQLSPTKYRRLYAGAIKKSN